MNMETSTVITGKPITHARLTNKANGPNIREVTVRRIDTIIAEHDLPKPYLLKFDVDGVELQVLAGAQKTLTKTSIVIVEVHPRDFSERFNFMVSQGFQIFDIVDICYYDNRLAQVDLIFLNTELLFENSIQIYDNAFDIKKVGSFQLKAVSLTVF